MTEDRRKKQVHDLGYKHRHAPDERILHKCTYLPDVVDATVGIGAGSEDG